MDQIYVCSREWWLHDFKSISNTEIKVSWNLFFIPKENSLKITCKAFKSWISLPQKFASSGIHRILNNLHRNPHEQKPIIYQKIIYIFLKQTVGKKHYRHYNNISIILKFYSGISTRNFVYLVRWHGQLMPALVGDCLPY